MAPGPNTSRLRPEYKVYPYLREALPSTGPSSLGDESHLYPAGAWFRLPGSDHGLVPRRVLSWRISNSMEAASCVDCLEEALRVHGKPEIFNSDQGSQFTSDAFTGVLERNCYQHG